MAEINEKVMSPEATEDAIGLAKSESPMDKRILTHDEYHLATLGYRQEFLRSLGFFESWAAVLTSMNFVSGIPVLFYFVLYTGGPQAAFANWTMVGAFSIFVSLSMAEIAAALPTAGGIYYWSYRLGGEKWGPFLSWICAWYNWGGWVLVVPGVRFPRPISTGLELIASDRYNKVLQISY